MRHKISSFRQMHLGSPRSLSAVPWERVVVHFRGGLGNQLFQLAAGLGVCEELDNCELRGHYADPYWRAFGPALADVIAAPPTPCSRRIAWLNAAPSAVPRERRLTRLAVGARRRMARPLRVEVLDPFAPRPPISAMRGIDATL